MKLKLKVVLSILFCIILLKSIRVEGVYFQSGIESFPETYQPYLKEINKKHSNWKFTALYTDLDWNYVINQENQFGKNLVPINYSDNWKNLTPGLYNVEVDNGWVDSSTSAVKYCMDPRNFLNEVRLFQFETLSYDNDTNSLNGIEKILYGTEFYNTRVSYLDSNGNLININENYSDLILRAGQVSQVSPYHLASRIKQEVGPFLSHSSISGTVQGFEGLYNFYNIGATSSVEPLGAIKNGLQYAKDGKNASIELRNKYLIPWNTKERAITGGAIFIGSSYIAKGQNTIYLQKFHVNDSSNNDLFWHQYMTNVLAPYSEAKLIYNGYQKAELLGMQMSFIIPIFNSMPEIPEESPNINKNDFKDDNTKVYCTATNVNVRTGPSTSYEVITQVSNGDKMTRIRRGISSGDRWDKVILENGIIGYVFQSYLEVDLHKYVTGILVDNSDLYMQEGDIFKITGIVTPEDANNKKVIYESDNEEVAVIDDNGVITAVREGIATIIVSSAENLEINDTCKVTVVRKLDEAEIKFEAPLNVEGAEISGLDYTANTVSNIRQKIITNFDIEIIDRQNRVLEDIDFVGTGSKILVKENGKILMEYNVILYGDANGDGKINTVDLLVIQRHILEIQKLDYIYMKASNVRKIGTKPTSVDLLLIQRHILALKEIEQ